MTGNSMCVTDPNPGGAMDAQHAQRSLSKPINFMVFFKFLNDLEFLIRYYKFE